MMYPTRTIKARLEAVRWFARCGEPPPESPAGYPVEYIDRGKMIRSYGSLKWLRALSMASSRMSDYLVRNHDDRYSYEWNRVAELGGAYFDKVFLGAFEGYRQTFGLSEAFVLWNRRVIIMIVAADHYSDLDIDRLFPEMVLASYEAGRYPCGWEGEEWEDGEQKGKLAVW